MRSLIDMAAERGPFIDQSQSLNLFVENPNIGQLSSMYFYAWKKGLKTTYYLRSRPATRIAKATVDSMTSAIPREAPRTPNSSVAEAPLRGPSASSTATDAVSCSLENPDICEACQ